MYDCCAFSDERALSYICVGSVLYKPYRIEFDDSDNWTLESLWLILAYELVSSPDSFSVRGGKNSLGMNLLLFIFTPIN